MATFPQTRCPNFLETRLFPCHKPSFHDSMAQFCDQNSMTTPPKPRSRSMSPSQLASELCANYHSGGQCLGLGISDQLVAYRFRPKGACTLPARCEYFEYCVIPTAFRTDGPVGARWREAALSYRRSNLPTVGSKPENLRRCSCGASLPSRKRVCETCRKAKNRQRNLAARKPGLESAV